MKYFISLLSILLFSNFALASSIAVNLPEKTVTPTKQTTFYEGRVVEIDLEDSGWMVLPHPYCCTQEVFCPE